MKREKRNSVVAIRKTIHATVPTRSFEAIGRSILGHTYELSLVLCGDALARKLNRTYRKKGYAANVLSFPLKAHEGEVFLNIDAARREAKKYGIQLKVRLTLLFVHACLHLKGLHHGKKMETREQALLRKFS